MLAEESWSLGILVKQQMEEEYNGPTLKLKREIIVRSDAKEIKFFSDRERLLVNLEYADNVRQSP